MQPILEARSLVKQYSSDGVTVAALRGVDLEVAAGEFVAVMGPSGSGKSTLLHLLGGLDRPSTGEVVVDGRPLTSLSRGELARLRGARIGFVFQLYNLIPSLTVAENTALPAIVAGRRPRSYAARVTELLDLVGLADKRHRYPPQLSGGEQQRVAVARGLVMDPAVLLADEPTGNLDSQSGAALMQLLAACNRSGVTIVLVTHDARVASQAHRVLYMRDGRLVEEARLAAAAEPVPALSTVLDLSDDRT